MHDNVFQGDGPGSGSGTQNGVLSESTLMLIENNTFDGIDGGSIYALPQGPGDTLDLLDILIGNIISNSGAARPIQVYPSTFTPNVLGTDENEAFVGDWGGLGGVDLSFDGRGGADHIYGDSGNDTFTGGADNDLLAGGAGIDTGVFADASVGYIDTAIGWLISSSEGNDFLQQMEIVEADGQRNLLVGSTGYATLQDALDGAEDGDNIRLATGTYSGTFNYDDDGLTIIAQPNAQINATFTPSGTQGITIAGANLADTITTGAGNDLIVGGGGNDTLAGGSGDDIYYVDALGDLVTELSGEGRDVVYTSASYGLAAGSHVDVLSAVRWSAPIPIGLFGNELAQEILGNAGANVIRGGGGADTLLGLGGNDEYYIGDAAERVLEDNGGGRDAIYASVDYVLAAGSDVEVLSTDSLIGTADIDLTGNALGQELLPAMPAPTVLDGGAGVDYLFGGAGADTFAFTTALGAGNVDDDRRLQRRRRHDRARRCGVHRRSHAGPLAAGAFVTGTAAQDADDRIIYDAATGQLFYDADGNGAGAQVLFGLNAALPASPPATSR